MSRIAFLRFGALALVLLGACGDDDETAADDGPSPQECVADLVDLTDGDIRAAELVERCQVSAAEAEAAVPATVAETEPEPPATTAVEEVQEAAPSTQPAAAPVAPPVEAAVMPDIPCGTDLQLAQDIVQAAGPWLSRSEDATGQDRFQVIDRNWVVVRSEPPPGTPIGEGDAVFHVVKDEEFTGC